MSNYNCSYVFSFVFLQFFLPLSPSFFFFDQNDSHVSPPVYCSVELQSLSNSSQVLSSSLVGAKLQSRSSFSSLVQSILFYFLVLSFGQIAIMSYFFFKFLVQSKYNHVFFSNLLFNRTAIMSLFSIFLFSQIAVTFFSYSFVRSKLKYVLSSLLRLKLRSMFLLSRSCTPVMSIVSISNDHLLQI